MAPLAQRLGLALLLVISGASLGLSILMLFTLRLVNASVADRCTPGGGCSVPPWVEGTTIGEKEWWWGRISNERYGQINMRWVPLTYGCIGYSALALLHLATYGYTHVAVGFKNTWTSVGCDILLQFFLGACGIVVGTLHLLVKWTYGRYYWSYRQWKTAWSPYHASVFSSQVCADLGPYCKRFHASIAMVFILGGLFILAAIAQLYYVNQNRASWRDSLASILNPRAVTRLESSGNGESQADSSFRNPTPSPPVTHKTPRRRESRELQDFVAPFPQPSKPAPSLRNKSPQSSLYSSSITTAHSSTRPSFSTESTPPQASHSSPSINPNRFSTFSDPNASSSSNANRYSTGSLEPPNFRASIYRSRPKTPSPLRVNSLSKDAPPADAIGNSTPGPAYFEPVRDHDAIEDSSREERSIDPPPAGPTIHVTRFSTSSQGHSDDRHVSNTLSSTSFEHNPTSDVRTSRPSSFHSNSSSRPSSLAVLAALEDLQAVLAAPSLTPDVMQSLQSRIAALHGLASPPLSPTTTPPSTPGGLLPTSPTNRHSMSSLPTSSSLGSFSSSLGTATQRKSLPAPARRSPT